VWQACRALLAATHMPVYDTGARELPREVAAEADSPSGRRKARAGRRQAAGKTAPPAEESPAAESSVADEAAPPTELEAPPSPPATETADPVAGSSPGAPEGGHDGEQAATPADESVDT
jgi:hypothetical protein